MSSVGSHGNGESSSHGASVTKPALSDHGGLLGAPSRLTVFGETPTVDDVVGAVSLDELAAAL